MRLILYAATVVLVCLGQCASVIQLNDQFGTIQSPGYPLPYNDNEDLTWEITTDPGYQIVVDFTVFDLEDSYDEDLGGACVYDYVQIEHLGTNRSLCGNHRIFPGDAPFPRQNFRSQNNVMTIRFRSDYSNENPRPIGFVAHYVVEDKDECKEMAAQVRNAYEDWDQLIYCNHFCINVPGSYYCSCRPGFELHENQHTCKGSCENQLITADEGEITSLDYPLSYSRLTDCDWTIRVRQGLTLNLQFNETFNIENHFNYSDCVYDYLKLTVNGVETAYCGNEAPNFGQSINTNVREVRLDFHTDNSIELSGFRMTYRTTRQRCLEPRNAPSNGFITNSNSEGYYEFEDEIAFECNPGYELLPVDGAVTVCQNDGSWTRQAPTCQIKSCGEPRTLSSVPYSTIVDVDSFAYTYGDIVVVECNRWYEMTSGTSEWRCSEDATWQPTAPSSAGNDVPVCTPVCGQKNGQVRALFGLQISGGTLAGANEWPWMVFINFGINPNVAAATLTCGGALISPDYVLTAAHCVTGRPSNYPPDGVKFANHTHVWVGTHNRLTDRGMNTRSRHINVESITRHPNYNNPMWDSDIALLRLAETVIMDDYVRPICLPTTPLDFNLLNAGHSTGEVAGWGLSSVHGRASYELRHAELPTVTRDNCWASFQRTANQLNINLPSGLSLTNNMFCAGFESGQGGSTCEGDSGGPFMSLKGSVSRYYTLGIVSFGVARTRCGVSVSYSVFAKLNPRNTQWINQIIIQ